MTERTMNFMRYSLERLLPLTSRKRNAVMLDPPEAPVIPETPDKLTQEITVMSFNVLTSVADITANPAWPDATTG